MNGEWIWFLLGLSPLVPVLHFWLLDPYLERKCDEARSRQLEHLAAFRECIERDMDAVFGDVWADR
jgi:hypothetical protein